MLGGKHRYERGMAQNKFKAYLKERQPFGDAVDIPFVNGAVTGRDLPDP